jgi:hypothetical protein
MPSYGYDSVKSDTKGQWASLAKALQQDGYSVLMFDMRGHGKSADTRTMDKPDLFCMNIYNKLASSGVNPKSVKDVKKERFSPTGAYYPYLVNDLTAARRFLDDKNDARECNSGRVFVVAEREICPLVMLWMATEYARYGVGPKTKLDDPELVSAGDDLCGAVFLSWQGANVPGANTAANLARNVMKQRELGSDTVVIGGQLKKKVAMAFIYGKEDTKAAAEARSWFNFFGLPPTAKEDKETVKYIRDIAGAEKLTGIKLLDITDKDKNSILQGQIIDFIKSTRTKSISGNNWKERNMQNLDAVPVPLNMWGLPAPR